MVSAVLLKYEARASGPVVRLLTSTFVGHVCVRGIRPARSRLSRGSSSPVCVLACPSALQRACLPIFRFPEHPPVSAPTRPLVKHAHLGPCSSTCPLACPHVCRPCLRAGHSPTELVVGVCIVMPCAGGQLAHWCASALTSPSVMRPQFARWLRLHAGHLPCTLVISLCCAHLGPAHHHFPRLSLARTPAIRPSRVFLRWELVVVPVHARGRARGTLQADIKAERVVAGRWREREGGDDRGRRGG